MNSKTMSNEKPKNLFSFLPSNLLSELDENINISNNSSRKGSNVSNFIYYIIF